MKNVIFAAAATFALGCVIGYFLGRKSNEKEFDDLLTKEIEDFRAAYVARESNKKDSDISEPESEGQKKGSSNYQNVVDGLGYRGAIIEDDNDEDWPYLITPDEFADCEGYAAVDMIYFQGDGVLIDEDYDIIDDPCKYLMEDFAEHFGDYEYDAIHVRNDKLKMDIQVILDSRKYCESIGDI